MNVKFMWNCIKIDGKLHRCFYSDEKLCNYSAGTLTIYARDYERIPQIPGLTIQNDSDSMTDYFETDRIRVTPGSTYHGQVIAAMESERRHRERLSARRQAVTA